MGSSSRRTVTRKAAGARRCHAWTTSLAAENRFAPPRSSVFAPRPCPPPRTESRLPRRRRHMLHRFVISLFCATLVPAVLAIAAVEFSRLGHTELSSAAIAHENTLYLAAGVAPLPVLPRRGDRHTWTVPAATGQVPRPSRSSVHGNVHPLLASIAQNDFANESPNSTRDTRHERRSHTCAKGWSTVGPPARGTIIIDLSRPQ